MLPMKPEVAAPSANDSAAEEPPPASRRIFERKSAVVAIALAGAIGIASVALGWKRAPCRVGVTTVATDTSFAKRDARAEKSDQSSRQ